MGSRRWLVAAAFVCIWLRPGDGLAAALEFDGVLTLDFLATPFPPPSFAGTDVAIALPSSSPSALATLRVRRGLSGSLTVLVTDPETISSQVFAARLSAGVGSGTLAPVHPPTLFGNPLTERTLPVPGVIRLCLLNASCANQVPIPLTKGSGTRGVGIGGLIGASLLGGLGGVSIEGAPWTLGTATLPITTPQGGTATAFAFGYVHGPFSFTGTTALPGGAVHVVTPIAAVATDAPDLSGFGHLDVRFVPEPGLLLLTTSGVVGLLVLGHRRIRS